MKLFLTVLFFLALNLCAYADVFEYKKPLSEIIDKLPELNDINCNFKQEKTNSSSNLKLVSGGTFSFTKNEGVIFNTTYPVKFTTTYNNKDYKQINDIINAISNKSYSKIENVFDFYFYKKEGVWHLGLKPKNNHKASKYLVSIEIIGIDYIKQIIITACDSTKTDIRFSK